MGLADEIAGWIAERVSSANATGAVLGLSGGIDSALVSGLCARGLGAGRVLGIVMPCHSSAADTADALLVAEAWGIEAHTVDLTSIYDAMIGLLPPGSGLADANLKPRLRMMTLYHHANTLNRLVVGTGNKSELMAGYFTKYGDAGVDVLPIAGLYKHQVRELSREIGVPERIIARAPSAGLWEGQTDESEMGITYADLDRTLAAIEAGDTSSIDPSTSAQVRNMIAASQHKRESPPIYIPGSRAAS